MPPLGLVLEKRHSVFLVLAEGGPLPRTHTTGAGAQRGTAQNTQPGSSGAWDKVHLPRKVQECLLERKCSTSGHGTGSWHILLQRGVVTFLATSESLKHFLPINRGVTVECANYNRALFVAVGAVSSASVMN